MLDSTYWDVENFPPRVMGELEFHGDVESKEVVDDSLVNHVILNTAKIKKVAEEKDKGIWKYNGNMWAMKVQPEGDGDLIVTVVFIKSQEEVVALVYGQHLEEVGGQVNVRMSTDFYAVAAVYPDPRLVGFSFNGYALYTGDCQIVIDGKKGLAKPSEELAKYAYVYFGYKALLNEELIDNVEEDEPSLRDMNNVEEAWAALVVSIADN